MADVAVGFIGRMALEARLVTPEQIHECVTAQLALESAGKTVPRLGELLVARGYITNDQLSKLLAIQQRKQSTAQGEAIREECFTAGTVIFRENDADHHDLFILMQGRVAETRQGRLLHEHAASGDFLGELSTLLKIPRPTTMTAVTDCRVYHVGEAQVEDFFRRKPALALRLAEILASRMHSILVTHVNATPGAHAMDAAPMATRSDSSIAAVTNDEIAAFQAAAPAPVPQARQTEEKCAPRPPEAITPPEPRPAIVDVDMPADDEVSDEALPALDPITAPEVAFVSMEDDPRLADLQDESAADEPAEEDAADQATPAFKLPDPTVPIPAPEPFAAEADADATPNLRIARIHNAVSSLSIPKNVQSAVSARLDKLVELEMHEAERQRLERQDDIPSELREETARQRRELDKLPSYDILRKSLDKLRERLADPARAPQGVLREAMGIAILQKEVLILRAETQTDHVRTCACAAVHEPLYAILSLGGFDASAVFGLTMHVLAIEELQAAWSERQDHVTALLRKREEERKSGSFLSVFRRKDAAGDPELDALRQEADLLRRNLSTASRELRMTERDLVEAFWSAYGYAAKLLCAKPAQQDAVFLRAFLRWGMLGCTKALIDPDGARLILAECAVEPKAPAFTLTSTPVLHPDEVILFTASGVLPQSPNEDLELNARNSPEWRADRAWRRLRHNAIRQTLLTEMRERLTTETDELSVRRDTLEAKLEHLSKIRTQTAKTETAAVKRELQTVKVEIGRKQRMVERITDLLLPRLEDDRAISESSLADSGVAITADKLIAHEVAMIRRLSRLAAKLKEPFLPLTLRAAARGTDRSAFNLRAAVQALLADAEKRDPLLFQEPLAPVAKRANRTLIRYVPFVLLTPCQGIMGFLLAPRNGLENGRFVLPGYCARGTSVEELLWTALSDFRYDTSKASAGVDVMTSDTLVARYAEVRWNLRKKDREVRQKAGIYTEENERTNWRRHYALYMKSAFDSGKQLFFKCPDLYELLVGKFIDLPADCEILKRG